MIVKDIFLKYLNYGGNQKHKYIEKKDLKREGGHYF